MTRRAWLPRPGFNIFVISNGVVYTPRHGSLRGVTQKSVLELCAELGIPAEVADIPRAKLEAADEVFLATTAGGVMPASRVGTHIMGNDRPGPISSRVKEHYWRRHKEGWHGPPVRYGAMQ